MNLGVLDAELKPEENCFEDGRNEIECLEKQSWEECEEPME